jgi:hypothetical protein
MLIKDAATSLTIAPTRTCHCTCHGMPLRAPLTRGDWHMTVDIYITTVLTSTHVHPGPIGMAPSLARRSLLILLERMAPYLAERMSQAAAAGSAAAAPAADGLGAARPGLGRGAAAARQLPTAGAAEEQPPDAEGVLSSSLSCCLQPKCSRCVLGTLMAGKVKRQVRHRAGGIFAQCTHQWCLRQIITTTLTPLDCCPQSSWTTISRTPCIGIVS